MANALVSDLRVLTVWRAEMAHFKSQHMPYRKTATEWEILGDLALRLHRKEEVRFSQLSLLYNKANII